MTIIFGSNEMAVNAARCSRGVWYARGMPLEPGT